MKGKTWIVELTINGSVTPVRVTAYSASTAKDAAEAKHPKASRIWNAYTVRQWREVASPEPEDDR